MSGDNSRNFKNETDSEIDGSLFGDEPLPSSARFLAREALQNSVDASRDERFTSSHGHEALLVTFRFRSLIGKEKEAFVNELGLRELRSRVSSLDQSSAAAHSNNCLHHLDDKTPLQVLYIDESGASGMYGPWNERGRSKMSIAMLSGNISEKPKNAGGAYGHGKSVNALASNIRVNVAYTCFDTDPLEPIVSRRLLGVTYWPDHSHEGANFSGWGLLGSPQSHGETVIPWNNEYADRQASKLGFTPRDPSRREDHGTSLLIVDPAMEPADLVSAIQRYWWPAISQSQLRVSVVTSEDDVIHVRPMSHPIIRNFVTAMNGIISPSAQPDEQMRVRPASRVNVLGVSAGDIAMVPAPIHTADDTAEQSSVIAYVRALGMVVRYRRLRIGPSYIHGVFRAHPSEDVETLLLKSEPKAHDRWVPNADESDENLREQIRLLVHAIDRSVLKEVKDYSEELSPPEDSRPVRFGELDRLLGTLLSEDGPELPGPEPTARDFSIRRSKVAKKAVGFDQIQVSGVITFERLDDKIDSCVVTLRYFIRDERGRQTGKDGQLRLELLAPSEFKFDDSAPGVLIGPCGPGAIQIEWSTPPYSRGWVGDLDVEVVEDGA